MTELSLTIETNDLKSGRGEVDPGTGGARVNGPIHCSTNSWNIKNKEMLNKTDLRCIFSYLI